MRARRSRAVDYTSSSGPRSRVVVIVVALAFVCVVGAGGWYWGRSSNPEPARTAVKSSSVVSGSGVEPGRFARTQEEAGQAAASYLRQVFALATAPAGNAARFAARIAAPGSATELLEQLAGDGLADRRDLLTQFVPVRVVTTPDPEGSVRFLIWGVFVSGQYTDGRVPRDTPIAQWTSFSGRMAWFADGWRLGELYSDMSGPHPNASMEADRAQSFAAIMASSGRAADAR